MLSLHVYVATTAVFLSDYISLLSDDDSEYVVSPSPPPVSPLTPCIDRY